MKISYSWLKKYIDPGVSPEKLAEILTMAGLEVESVNSVAPSFDNVVVGQILSVEKHPNADKLSLCKVKTDKATHQIVCGATNMKANDSVALALPGAHLPNGLKIKESKIRGVVSEGMMCSSKELSLGEDESGILILDSDVTLGSNLVEVLDLQDSVLDIDILPNRPDCLSVMGIAREVSAITGKKLTIPSWHPEEIGGDINDYVSVKIDAPSHCNRYTARLVKDVTIGESPRWLKNSIEKLGIRSINNVVDITNYVMFDRGQPLHAFNYQSIEGKSIIIRLAGEGEKMVTLDGEERTLDKTDLVIADKKKPLALAGIMGGLSSEITMETNSVLLESAYFFPLPIRRSSKKLGLMSDSSFRFERGVDPGGNIIEALNEAAQLIAEITGGKVVKGLIDKEIKTLSPSSFIWRPSVTNKLLGTNIKKDTMVNHLNALDIKVEPTKNDTELLVSPPSYRVDLKGEAELTEEIARFYGYDKVAPTLPKTCLSTVKRTREMTIEDRIKNFLVNTGFLEVINYSFVSLDSLTPFSIKENEKITKIINPLTEEQSVMRFSLIPSLIENLKYNINYRNYDLKLFEINTVFSENRKGANHLDEGKRIAGLWSGMRYHESWNLSKDKVDFYDVKGIVENLLEELNIGEYTFTQKSDISYIHPGKRAAILINNKEIGCLGEIHPNLLYESGIKQPVFIFDFDLKLLQENALERKRFKNLPRYPYISRDIAVLVDENLPAQELINYILESRDENIENVEIFDLYKGNGIPCGKKSVAYRVRYQSRERTLVDEEVNKLHEEIIKKIKDKFDAEIR